MAMQKEIHESTPLRIDLTVRLLHQIHEKLFFWQKALLQAFFAFVKS
jgi:hypothetical protein